MQPDRYLDSPSPLRLEYSDFHSFGINMLIFCHIFRLSNKIIETKKLIFIVFSFEEKFSAPKDHFASLDSKAAIFQFLLKARHSESKIILPKYQWLMVIIQAQQLLWIP